MNYAQRLSLLLVGLLCASPSFAAGTVDINGAGGTFPAPIYQVWLSNYRKVDPSVEINYNAIGSGAGIQQTINRTVDFGASDAAMSDKDLKRAEAAHAAVFHIPTVLGAVVITYNLPDLKLKKNQHLRLTGDVIADIFMGKITNWNDPRITKLNPGVKLPADMPILVAHRSDGSGTTAVFSNYLSKVSPEWKKNVGSGVSLNWPVGLGGKGNDGVTNLVKQTPGGLGFVELTYAQTNGLPYAELKNKAGNFVVPSPQTVSNAAAADLKMMPKDFRLMITDAAGKNSYPIASFTYLLVYKTMPQVKGEKFKKFVDWALTQGQKMVEKYHYAPLPKSLVSKELAVMKRVKLTAAK